MTERTRITDYFSDDAFIVENVIIEKIYSREKGRHVIACRLGEGREDDLRDLDWGNEGCVGLELPSGLVVGVMRVCNPHNSIYVDGNEDGAQPPLSFGDGTGSASYTYGR